MTKSWWTLPAIVAGIVLMLAGPWIVSALLPATAVWTDEDQAARGQAAAQLHASLHSPGNTTGQGPTSAEAASADVALKQQDARRDRSLARRTWLILGTRFLGVLLAGIGVVGYLISRRS